MNPIFVVFGLLILGLFLHMPIGFALGFASISTLFICDLYPPSFIIQTFYSSTASFTTMAIPFFILAGDLMLSGGISNRLVKFGQAIFGHIRGSLGVISVFSCMIFAAISGSGPATTAAIGGIMIPAMADDGYDRSFAGALTACAGALGPIIPPSIMFAIYGVTCGVSITDLFAAGLIPGLIMGLVLIVIAMIVANKYQFGTVQPRATNREIFLAVKDAIWALLAPVIILGGIYTGVFTPTEAAVVSCIYSLVIGLFVYKELKFKNILSVFARSAATTGSCLILFGGANLFARILSSEGLPSMLQEAMLSFTESKLVCFLLVNLILFAVGMFMETASAMLILAPILVNIVGAYGMTPLHFGVIMVMNLSIGLATPPVGVNLFVAAKAGDVSLEGMIKWLVPIIGCMLALVVLFSFTPDLINFLPDLMRSLRT